MVFRALEQNTTNKSAWARHLTVRDHHDVCLQTRESVTEVCQGKSDEQSVVQCMTHRLQQQQGKCKFSELHLPSQANVKQAPPNFLPKDTDKFQSCKSLGKDGIMQLRYEPLNYEGLVLCLLLTEGTGVTYILPESCFVRFILNLTSAPRDIRAEPNKKAVPTLLCLPFEQKIDHSLAGESGTYNANRLAPWSTNDLK